MAPTFGLGGVAVLATLWLQALLFAQQAMSPPELND
jgi:hypothetical protein